jgi:hypothetical protein
MTTPELDPTLERLFSAARAATAPAVGARERIRAGLSPRLASDAAAPPRALGSRAWLGAGLAALGVCGAALWLTSTPPVNETSAPVASRAAASASPVVALPDTTASAAPPATLVKPAVSLPSSKSTVSSIDRSNPAEELPLVRAMQQALRAGSPSQALALAADHARRFPRGSLLEEREGVRAVAGCQLAPADARAPILAAFTKRFSTSPYAARVKAACQ